MTNREDEVLIDAIDEVVIDADGWVNIPVDLPVSVIATLAIAAHQERVTLNEFLMTRVIEYCQGIIDDCNKKYNPKFGDDKECSCGHTYYRHFDSYEEMEPVGCKYCVCDTFEPVVSTK